MPYFVMEEIERSHPLMLAAPMRGFADSHEFGVEKSVGEAVVEERQGVQKLIFPREAFTQSGKSILEKVLKEPEWATGLNDDIEAFGNQLFVESEALLHIDVSKLSDEQMASIYDRLFQLQYKSHASGIPWVVLEFDHAFLTNYLLDYLKKQLQKKPLPISCGEIFSILTTPTQDSFAQKEEKSLLSIASRIQDARVRKLFESQDLELISQRLGKFDPQTSALLDRHVADYGWLPYMYEGPAWSKAYFIQVLQGLLKQDVRALLKQVQSRNDQLRQRQEELQDLLQVDKKHQELIHIAQGLVFTKGFRKDCLYHFFFCLEPFLKESAKRLGLSLRQTRRFMPWELPEALRKGEADEGRLNERWKRYVYHLKDGGERVLTGKDAENFMQTLPLEKPVASADIRQLSGDCACPGFARGIVKKVDRPADMPKMQKGDVLVAHATNPDIAPAMKIASAIVTDLGGITCHAAIVSLELKIPCIIGTKVATSVLQDGQAVEVDATHGRVTKIG